MKESLPYLAWPGSITKCLEKISDAATPEKVTGDFVSTKLGMKGGAGRALVPFLKKLGFVNSDGTPSDIYKRYRNSATAAAAIAEAIKIGYSPLYAVNEYCHDLNDNALKGIIVQITGQEAASSVVKLTVSTFQNLKALADFDSPIQKENTVQLQKFITPPQQDNHHQPTPQSGKKIGMNLSYTINLNLPATSDITVFNAIFKSLKESLLNTDEIE